MSYTRPDPTTNPPNIQPINLTPPSLLSKNKVHCVYCGVWNHSDINICAHCGAPLNYEKETTVEGVDYVRNNSDYPDNFFVSVRNGPSIFSKQVSFIRKKDPIEIFETKDGWGRIGKKEWINLHVMGIKIKETK